MEKEKDNTTEQYMTLISWNGDMGQITANGGWNWAAVDRELAQALSHMAEQAKKNQILAIFPPIALVNKTDNEKQQVLAGWRDLAKKWHINIITGSIVDETDNGLVHSAYYMDSEGTVVGKTQQTHLTEAEKALGWQASNDLPLLETNWGKVAILLGRDCWQPEVWRLVTLAGVQLAVALSAVTTPYSKEQQLAGVWQNVQQNQVLAAECCIQGQWQGKEYDGRNKFFAPCEITPDSSGIINGTEAGNFLWNVFDLIQLAKVRSEYPLLDQLHVCLYQNQLLQLYSSWSEKVKGK